MTKLAVTLSLVAVLAAVHGLGGRFRSFNPELLANLGYGAYADYKHSPSVTTNKQTNKQSRHISIVSPAVSAISTI